MIFLGHHNVDLDAAQFAEGLRSQGTPEWMIEDLVFLERVKAAGWAASVSPTVEQITGRAPESLTDFIARHEQRYSLEGGNVVPSEHCSAYRRSSAAAGS
jgi:hypothetical protein